MLNVILLEKMIRVKNNGFYVILGEYVDTRISQFKYSLVQFLFNSGLTKKTTVSTLLSETMLSNSLDDPQII